MHQNVVARDGIEPPTPALFRVLITCASNYLEDFVGGANTAKYM
jgi:hypothetical protein